MRYFTYTYVDAQTGRPVTESPAVNGPMAPEGVVFGFALESRYPTETPTFYGKKEGALDLPGIISVITKAEYDAAEAAEMEARSELVRAAVNTERDRRMVAGFDFQGIRFQSRPEDRENIMGAFALASTALTVGGKQPGDLRWHGGSEDFVFIAEDNTRVPMDAVAVLGLGQAAAAQKSSLTFAANDLKKLEPIPADFAADQYWP